MIARPSRLAALAAAGAAALFVIAPLASSAPSPSSAATEAPAATTPAAPVPSAPSAVPSPPGPAARARGAQMLLAGKAPESAAAYQEALAADPADELAMEGRVRALIAAGQWPQALTEARRFAAGSPRSPLVGSALGEALYRAGLLSEASSSLAPFASQEAPPARALMTLGLVRVAEGKEDVGARLLDRALALAPQDRDVIREAAGASETRAEAVALLTRYLDLSAGDDPDRIEGARGTIRTYTALGERKVWVRATHPERVELPLSAVRHPSGALSGFVVELSVAQGKPIRVLLDSGSTGLFLLERIAAKGGLSPLAEETTFAGGGEGRHPNKSALLAAAGIGDLRFTDALVTTTSQEIEPTGRYHGVLGLGIFQGYRVTIDLSREKLLLETAPPAPAGAPGATSAGAPYWSVASQMLVEASSQDGRQGLFLFDTGASASLLSLDFADAARAWIGGVTNVRGYGGTLRDAREVRGVKLRFLGLETSGAPMTASDLTQRSRLGGVEVSGYLGLDLLARTVVTVDTVARRVFVAKAGKR